MLAEFLSGVDIYLAVFRDSNVDYSGQMAKINKVPKAFNWIKNAAEKRWKAFAERDRKEALASRYMPGDESKVPINPQEGVGWTEGNEFADMYSKMHGRILERDDLDSIPSMANGSQPIDTGIAPWRSTGSRALKNGNGTASSNDVIFKSETPITQATKTNKEQRSAKNALTERHQKITESPNSKAKHHTSEAEDPTAIGAGAMLRGTTDLSIDVAPAKYEYPQPAHLQSPASYASDGSQSNAVGKNIERKGPVDWFDCDSSFSDRSRTSSVGSDSVHSKSYSQQALYEKEFPMLSPAGQKSASPGRNTPENDWYDNMNSIASAVPKSNALRGVNNPAVKPRSLGRAKNRDFFAITSPLASEEIAKSGNIGSKNTMAFPQDDDLLQTNPILKAEAGSPVSGRKMKVHRIIPK